MKTLNPIRFALLTAAALFTHVTFAGEPPPPSPSSGTLVLDYYSVSGIGYTFGLKK